MQAPQLPLFKVRMPQQAHAMLQPVFQSGRLAAGQQVAEFERQLAAWFDVPAAATVSDASAGVALALYVAGVRPGDEVLVPALACAATVMPIANLFAKPVWCDIDAATGMPGTAHLAAALTEKTRAILLYHWSGDVADVDAVVSFAKEHGLAVVEDASEAFGARWRGRRLGGIADFSVYSFYATKPLTTGEGGVVLASDSDMLARIKPLRRFGFDPGQLRMPNGDLNPDMDIALAGFNVPMNEIAATLGQAGLITVDEALAAHRANGAFYETALASIPGINLLRRDARGESAYWTYSLLAERREDLIRKLLDHGIGAQRLHVRVDGFSCFGGKRHDLPGTAQFDSLNLSIPCGWWVGASDRERVAACIRSGW